MLIVYNDNDDSAWQPINYMVRLAAELFDAELLLVGMEDKPSLVSRLEACLGRGRGDETCLLISRDSGELLKLLLVPRWRKRFRHVAAWVIDSFWPELIPRSLRYARRPFDQIFVTTDEDEPEWRDRLGVPTSCLPWGSDVLRLGSGNTDRPVDLMRVGRQPPGWSSDEVSARACAEAGIKFHGRPQYFEDNLEGQRNIMAKYGQCKFMLAFSNGANPTNYTHPTREYLTARWVDPIASGTVVAGILPKTQVIDRMYWPGASLDLGSVDREEGLRVIADAVQAWRPEHAIENHRHALERVDWRWRFAEIAKALGESPKPLQAELRLLTEAADKLRPIPDHT